MARTKRMADQKDGAKPVIWAAIAHTAQLALLMMQASACFPAGSDDMNVRVWKANASEQLGTLLPRERKRQQYNAALVERHKHLPGEMLHLPIPITSPSFNAVLNCTTSLPQWFSCPRRGGAHRAAPPPACPHLQGSQAAPHAGGTTRVLHFAAQRARIPCLSDQLPCAHGSSASCSAVCPYAGALFSTPDAVVCSPLAALAAPLFWPGLASHRPLPPRPPSDRSSTRSGVRRRTASRTARPVPCSSSPRARRRWLPSWSRAARLAVAGARLPVLRWGCCCPSAAPGSSSPPNDGEPPLLCRISLLLASVCWLSLSAARSMLSLCAHMYLPPHCTLFILPAQLCKAGFVREHAGGQRAAAAVQWRRQA